MPTAAYNAQGLPLPAVPADPDTKARYAWALAAARFGMEDPDIQDAIGGEEGPATVAALAEWLERERKRGLVDLAQCLHMSAVVDPGLLRFAVKARLRWTDDLPPAVPPAPSIVVNIPGLTLQDPTA